MLIIRRKFTLISFFDVVVVVVAVVVDVVAVVVDVVGGDFGLLSPTKLYHQLSSFRYFLVTI